jgi:alpha-beta hydrolase superfamily lysophospholipase
MLAQGNGLDPQMIAHAPDVVRAYLDDPLVHDRISARLARATLDSGSDRARAGSAAWSVPTLAPVRRCRPAGGPARQ